VSPSSSTAKALPEEFSLRKRRRVSVSFTASRLKKFKGSDIGVKRLKKTRHLTGGLFPAGKPF
jgi:hypothetical protein